MRWADFAEPLSFGVSGVTGTPDRRRGGTQYRPSARMAASDRRMRHRPIRLFLSPMPMCWGLSRALELGELQETNERSLAALFPGVPERERPQADVDEPDAGDDSQVVVATVRILEGQLFWLLAARWRVSRLRTVGRWNLKAERMPSGWEGWDPETRCSRPRRGREGNPYGAGICYVQRAKRVLT